MKSFLEKILLFLLVVPIFFMFSSVLSAKDKTFEYLSNIDETTSQVGYSKLKKNENEDGNLISLMINGRRMYSMNAIYAHASSSIVYDLSKYPDFDTFKTYIGVDASRGTAGDGVKFYIYASKDNDYKTAKWTQLHSSEILKGNTEAEKVVVSIKDYKWLKLEADKSGSNASDHAVYFDAMIYNEEKYTPTSVSIPFIKSLEEYDEELKGKSDKEIVTNYEDILLKRTLVDRVGYEILVTLASSSKDKEEVLSWLFTNTDVLKKYLTGGEPVGPYIKSINILSDLYKKYKSDLESEHSNTYLTMMLAISLTHSSDVYFWVSGKNGEKVLSDPIKRYEMFKSLYEQGLKKEINFETDYFESLTVEEMRWVVNTQLSDEEIPWLNWYSTRTQPYIEEGVNNPLGYTKYSNRNKAHTSTNPYTYIAYSKGWNYYDTGYYKTNSDYCSTSYLNKFDANYKRGASCDAEYGITKWNIGTNNVAKPRLWIVFEEDGVCGALSKTGSNLLAVYGYPTAVIGQPGHAAYMVPSYKLDENGNYKTSWGIGNAVSGWSRSEKGERFLLDWGSKSGRKRARYNMAYIILAQRALDEFDTYESAFLYNLVANLRTTDEEKITSYENAIKEQTYNFDAWYELVSLYLKDETKTEEDYLDLARRITVSFFEFPLAMSDLISLFEDKFVINQIAFKNLLDTTLNKQKTVSDSDYFQASAIRDIATSLLGNEITDEIATFSFDGTDAGVLKLAGKSKQNKVPFEYSLNYEYDGEKKEISENTTWTQLTGGETEVDLKSKIGEMSAENDIVVHIIGTTLDVDHLFFIDLEEGHHPTKVNENELERRVAGIDENIAEWVSLETEEDMYNFFTLTSYESLPWKKFKDELPKIKDEGGDIIVVRNGYTSNYLPSDPVFTFFEEKAYSDEFSYVPVDRQTVTTSSSSVEGNEALLVDRSKESFWTSAKGDETPYVIIELNSAIRLSKIEYLPRQDGQTMGNILKAKIETSVDGEHWSTIASEVSWKRDGNIKTFKLDTPVRAKYIKVTSLESFYNYTAVAMFNIYENKIINTINVDELHISYVKEGYTYNGKEIIPPIQVKDGDKELLINDNYTLSFENNINAGTAKFTLTGHGLYEGSITKEFIINKAEYPEFHSNTSLNVDVNKKKLSDIPLPEHWTWKNGETPLVSGETIKALAVYDDTQNYINTEKEITIYKEKGNHPVITFEGDITEYTFELSDCKDKSIEDFKKLIKITDTEDGVIDLNSPNVIITSDVNWLEVGTYHINIKVTDTDNLETTSSLQIVIIDSYSDAIELNSEDYEIIIDNEELYYNGNEQNINVKVRKKSKLKAISILNINLHELTLGSDYDIEFSELTKAGKHTVVVKGKNIYSGELIGTYTIKKAKKPTNMVSPLIKVSNDTTSLEQIHLDTNWQWVDEGISLNEGENKVKIVFLGDENHERYETDILIFREKITETPTEEPTEVPKEDVPEVTSPQIEAPKKPSTQSNSQNSLETKEKIETTEENQIEDTEEVTVVKEETKEETNEPKEEPQTEQNKPEENIISSSKDKNSFPFIVIPIVLIPLVLIGFVVKKSNF